MAGSETVPVRRITLRRRRERSEAAASTWFLVRLALFVLALRCFVFSPFSIPSESMLPRLEIGDCLFISKWNYGWSRWSLPGGVALIPPLFWRTPARGDVVVFKAPGEDHDVIKRVIGVPGDTVQMVNGQVVLNGQRLPQQRVADFVLPLSANFDAQHCDARFQGRNATGQAICRYPQYRETLPDGRNYTVLDQGDFADRDHTGVSAVPAGHLFVMGDNRDDSGDSRFAPPEGMGMVPIDHVEGRAWVTFWSVDGSESLLKPWTWFTAARPARIGRGF